MAISGFKNIDMYTFWNGRGSEKGYVLYTCESPDILDDLLHKYSMQRHIMYNETN